VKGSQPGEQFIIHGRGSEQLRLMSEWWEATVLRSILDDWTAMRVDLCLTEAVANVLEHGYGEEGTVPWIRISLGAESAGVRILVEDHAPLYDPLQRGPKNLNEDLQQATIGGRGILLMRRYANELGYRRKGDRNCLSMLVKPNVG